MDQPLPFGRRLLVSSGLPLTLLVAGFIVRLVRASSSFLNPDEAWHYLLSNQPSLWLTYQACLTTAHPPLLILLLRYWSVIGTSELILRMPSILAGTVFCWVMFLWLRRAAGQSAALAGLALLLFSPPLIQLSAEIRQYALLLVFMASCLYFFDRALQENSVGTMLLASLALDLAMLSHYSSFIFALVFGVYSLLRLYSSRAKVRISVVWLLGQLISLALALFLLSVQVSRLQQRGIPYELASTYHSPSIFHAGRDHLLPFFLKTTARLFGYLAGSKAVGAVDFVAFTLGIILVFRNKKAGGAGLGSPAPLHIGLLLLLPFVVNCGFAIAGRYPYGGTRHNIFLAPFAMTGVAIAWAGWKTSKPGFKTAALVATLVVSNVFPAKTGPYIALANQNKRWMAGATSFMRHSLPAGSIIFTDGQGGFLLSYYLCHRSVVQFAQHSHPFLKTPCGEDEVITPDPDLFIFQADTLPPALRAMGQVYGFDRGSSVWLVRAGWLVNQQPEVDAELQQMGCGGREDFGRNISICEIRLPANTREAIANAGNGAANKKRASKEARF